MDHPEEYLHPEKPESPGRGQPTLWQDGFLNVIKHLARLGATDDEIADALGVAVRTLQYWKHDHPEIVPILKVGKRQADDRVKRSLYQRAVGFEHDAVKVSFDKDGKPLYAPYREFVVPDTTACIFWLKNRMPEQFRDRAAGETPENPLHLKIEDVRDELIQKLAGGTDTSTSGE